MHARSSDFSVTDTAHPPGGGSSRSGSIPGRTFEAFYAEHQGWAVQLAWLLTHDRTAAEDVAQDAFTAVYRRFDQIDNAPAYLRRSIVNGANELGRRVGLRQRKLRALTAGAEAAVPGPTGGLADVIAELPPRQRAAIVLRYWAGLPDDAIAEAIGGRPGTVRSLISRAKKELRRQLRDG